MKEVRLRIALVKTAFCKHKKLLQRNASMSLKKKMIHSYIRSVVTYGSEAWTINKEVKNKINAFECWIYGMVLKISWKDRVSNNEVLDRMGMKHAFTKFCCKEKTTFFGHICRGSNGNDIMTILERSVDGIRS